jgi:hypothetical protein
MFKKFRKKGYYFIIDAFIGATIIFLSLMIILNQGVRPTPIQYNYEMAEEYSSFIFTTKIIDVINNPYVEELIDDKHINDTSLTIMDQVNLFYYRNNAADLQRAKKLIENLTVALVPVEKYSFSYNIIDPKTTPSTITNIYNVTNINITEAKIVIASKKITFLQINSTTMFGPATTEIKIWI